MKKGFQGFGLKNSTKLTQNAPNFVTRVPIPMPQCGNCQPHVFVPFRHLQKLTVRNDSTEFIKFRRSPWFYDELGSAMPPAAAAAAAAAATPPPPPPPPATCPHRAPHQRVQLPERFR
jgi:hypothetical protein